jgi:REP element-mobilizing transposase RayT|tara:strand:+ start:527 stop:832 length:306 start_codon:yes stop_codon:yes gene_type:complete
MGTLHHVMIEGIDRRRIADDDQDRNDFVARLGAIATETATTIYAWTLLSNHAHILLSSRSQGLSTFMRRLLTGYAIAYNFLYLSMQILLIFSCSSTPSPKP